MGLTHSNPANRHPHRRRSAETNVNVRENVPIQNFNERQEPELEDVNVILPQNDRSADQEFPIRRQMYFPFHTEDASNLPPPGSWYDEQQNRSSQEQAENDDAQRERDEVSLHIALTIVNELAELSAWLQRQSSALEASSHITFDAEGRPVFDFSRPITRGPTTPIFPPSYSRATADSANLPSLNASSNQPADYQRFLDRYSANINNSPVQYGTPPPSYSRATSQQCSNPSQTLMPPPLEPGVISRTPPPSYRRAIRDHRERPHMSAVMEITPTNSNNNASNNNYVSNVTVG